MAVSAFQKLVNKLFKQFTLHYGREPQTPAEWMSIQNEAVQYFNKTKGVPPGSKKPPFKGFTPKVIEGGKPKKGIESLLETGDVTIGTAPKTKPRKPGLDQATQKDVIKEEWIAKKKADNKAAIERFKEKTQKKTVEDFRDKGDWDPSGMATGGLAYMLGEPNTRTEALQEFGVVTDPWGMYTDPSLYAKGERSAGAPQRAPYSQGGVGHGPWTMGQAAPTPDQEQNLDTPQPQVMGTPNPMHMPQGIPSVAPRTMQPQYQQQMMQQAMMQQMNPQHRMPMGKGGISRRAFMKLMSGLAALPFIGKGVQKAAPKAIKEVSETIVRDADGIPKYAFDLIEVVKAKGTKEIMEGIYKKNPPATKYNYKGVEVTEDGLGNTSVQKQQTKTGSWTDEASDSTYVDDYVDREVGFEIRKGEDIVKDEGLETQKSIRGADEYEESTAYMQGDPEGGMDVSEIVEVIEEADHLDLKKIADEIKDLPVKKASGGLARVGYAAGKIVKGGKWVIKNLEQALKELAEGTFKKELGPMEKEAFKWEIRGLIGRIKMGEPIPEDMIKTMRQDKRFKDITKTRSTDPELYEFEEVLLDTSSGKNLEQKEILEQFDVTGKKGHAYGGLAHMLGE